MRSGDDHRDYATRKVLPGEVRPDRAGAGADPGRRPGEAHRLRRPVLRVPGERGDRARGRDRQEGGQEHQPGRRRPGHGRGEDGVRLLGRDHGGEPAAGRAAGALHRGRLGPVGCRGRAGVKDGPPGPLFRAGPAHRCPHPDQGRPPASDRPDRAGLRPPHHEGDGYRRQRAEAGPGRHLRGMGRRGRPPSAPLAGDLHRGGSPARTRRAPDGDLRRRRSRRVQLLPGGRALRPLRAGGGPAGHRQPGRRRRTGRHHGCGPGPRLARHPPPRGGRPRSGGRLQPQGYVGLQRPPGRAGRFASLHGGGRRDDTRAGGAPSTWTTRGRRPSATSSSRTAS